MNQKGKNILNKKFRIASTDWQEVWRQWFERHKNMPPFQKSVKTHKNKHILYAGDVLICIVDLKVTETGELKRWTNKQIIQQWRWLKEFNQMNGNAQIIKFLLCLFSKVLRLNTEIRWIHTRFTLKINLI